MLHSTKAVWKMDLAKDNLILCCFSPITLLPASPETSSFSVLDGMSAIGRTKAKEWIPEIIGI